MTRPYDVWALRRLLIGHTLDDGLQAVSEPLRPLFDHLAALPLDARLTAWEGFLCGRADRDPLVKALAEVDPEGSPPETAAARSFATLEDIAKIMASEQSWLWKGWIAAGVFNTLAAEPGVGKSRFVLDLARRLWFGLPWPDGQENKLPEKSRTLWIQGDRAFSEMLQAARDFGLPDDAVALGAPPDDPTGGLNLDDEETRARLSDYIEAAAPAFVAIDTVGMVTGRNLCRPEEAREFFGSIIDLAGKTGVPFLGLTHLSKDKEALGRRIVEKARVVIMMTQPDPDGQPNRRRLWVNKSAVVKPPALGITMADKGNDYDSTPPTEAEPNRGGRPAEARAKARQLIIDSLNDNNDLRATDLCASWEEKGGNKNAFWRAKDDLVKDGVVVCEGRPLIMHLVRTESLDDPEPTPSPWDVSKPPSPQGELGFEIDTVPF